MVESIREQPRFTPPTSESRRTTSQPDLDLKNEQAICLIRAMINAAKADGRIDQQEQNSIVERLGDVSQDELNFLREEFGAKLDVREFAWSVPLGMEQQVYSLSLMAIDLDENAEAQYLHELAHGLRIAPETVNALHDRLGAPQIYS